MLSASTQSDPSPTQNIGTSQKTNEAITTRKNKLFSSTQPTAQITIPVSANMTPSEIQRVLDVNQIKGIHFGQVAIFSATGLLIALVEFRPFTTMSAVEGSFKFASAPTFTINGFKNSPHLDKDSLLYSLGCWFQADKWTGRIQRDASKWCTGGKLIFPNENFWIDLSNCHGLIQVVWASSTFSHYTDPAHNIWNPNRKFKLLEEGNQDKGKSSHYQSYRRTIEPDRAYSDSFRLIRSRPTQLSSGFTPFRKQKISVQESQFFTIPGSFHQKRRIQRENKTFFDPRQKASDPMIQKKLEFLNEVHKSQK
ncbi:hypothetical protein O181_102849 [Austropuccinia psidii MF-1]|uniref:Tet-like 2OG-Fe(II) oxygenase domain-containing protein n=1 Tax=Austropuccinia psidii MF-1 TaxID=1389203 RepID=A0A9Q3PIM3_9BASI|nr:hypothetical protein [Austropuccinia psidii MF-1]